jgi:hypothetical protein
MSFTVTATESAAKANGMAMAIRVLTGAAASQPGATAGATGAGASTASQAITPSGTGSLIYGAILGGNTTLTALSASTPFLQQLTQNSLRYVQLRSTSTTISGTPVTVGASSATTGIGIAVCEILAAPGQTLVEDASAPAVASSNLQLLTSAAFTPPAGALLVLMLSTNGISGAAASLISDTSGLSLTWTERIKEDGSGDGYAGVWTAQMPGVKSGGFLPFWTP